MKVLQKKVDKYGKVIEEIEKDVAEVKSIKDRFGKKARF